MKTAAALAVIVGAGLVLAAPTAAQASTCPNIPAVAHRGGIEHYVENTRNSFRDATNRGVPLWETDVQFTSDDQPIIMHDPDVDRTTDGTGPVNTLTLAQIQALHTADGQPVPTLAELVNDAQVDGAKVFVELKTNPTTPQWVTFLAALTSRAGMTAKLVITSFDSATLDAAATNAPAYQRGWIQDVGDVDPATVTPHAHILIKAHDSITWGRMTTWTNAGLQVYAWTVDTTAEWLRMTYDHVAGTITNNPTAYLAWQKTAVC